MDEQLYSEHPEAYDALYARKDYDAVAASVLSQLAVTADVHCETISYLMKVN